MRRYFIEGREVRKDEWSEAFKRFPDASIVLRTNKLPAVYCPPSLLDTPILPDKLQEYRRKQTTDESTKSINDY